MKRHLRVGSLVAVASLVVLRLNFFYQLPFAITPGKKGNGNRGTNQRYIIRNDREVTALHLPRNVLSSRAKTTRFRELRRRSSLS